MVLKSFFIVFIVAFSFGLSAVEKGSESPLRLCNPVDLSIVKVPNVPGAFEASANITYDRNFPALANPPTVKMVISDSKRKKLQSVDCKLLEKVKIKIPQKGETTLFCEILTDKLSVIGQRSVLFKDGIPLNLTPDGASPKVITLAPFGDFTRCPNTIQQVMHVRDKVIANLIQNYNVVILTRSNSMSLADEKKLQAVNQLNKTSVNPQGLIGTDTALTGYFNIARKTRGNSSNVDLGTVLLISDLNNPEEDNYKKVEFIPNEPKLFDGDVTKEIVKALKLKPKKQASLPADSQQLNETWVVMPITRLETEATMNAPADKNLAMEIELALQESGRVKRIVDHSDLEKIIDELKISSFELATGSAAGKIAGLLGADKIITGVIGRRFFKKKGLRFDLFLVDAKTGQTLGAVSAGANSKTLDEVIKKLVPELVNKKYELPELKNVDSAFLKKEALLYEEIFFKWYKSRISQRNIVIMSKAFAEVIYLIEGKDNKKVHEMASHLLNRTKTYELPIATKIQLGEFINKIMKPIPFSKDTPYTLLYRSLGLSLIPGRSEDALSLANRHIQEHPKENRGYANFVLANCYYSQKDYGKAIEMAEQGDGNTGANLLLFRIFQDVKDSKYDPKELACLKALNARRDRTGILGYRRLLLTLSVEGPQAALKYIRRLYPWTRVRPEIRLQAAKAHIALGNKKEAATIIDGIANEKALKRTTFKDPKMKAELKAEVYKLREALDSHIVPWKRLAEVIKIPEKYKFYIRPVGNPDMTMINNAVPLMEEYLGCRVEVLPTVPIPDDPVCFDKGRGQYHSYAAQIRLKNAANVPGDAISIAEVTEKSIFCGRLRFVYASPYYGSFLISYNSWYGPGNDGYVLADMLAKTACLAIKTNARISSCPETLCMNSSDGTATGSKNKRFQLCPRCCEIFSKKTPEWIYNSFHRRYKWKLKLEDFDKQKYLDDYTVIVDKTLAEAKKKAEEEAKKLVNYFPALTFDKELPKGLTFKYFEFEKDACKSTKDFEKQTPKATGVANAFNLKNAKRKDNYGLIFEGYIKIPADGKYQLFLSSDDGSRLWIDDKEIINNDKMQAPNTKSAEVALKAGYHKIKVAYIQGGKGALFTLYYRGPKTLGQQIPADILFHKK